MAPHVVPDWVKDAIFYEIVPDRFARGSRPRTEPVATDAFEPWDAEETGRAYRGGDLYGVVERLDWLADLGVTALYLTPVHVSPTYHRYKPIDHFHVDPLLGGDEAFDVLVEEAHARGLRLVLDGVFNHVGLGFRAFADVLEYGERSPYRDWFHIASFPVRPFDPSEPPSYRCWNGNPTMPVLDQAHPAVRALALAVAEHWIRRGADGWRFDAVGEMGEAHDFWREMRRRVRALDPNAYLVGEYWLDPAPWLDGTQWDGATNFPFAFSCREFVGGARLDPGLRLPGQGSAAHVDARELARRFDELFTRHPYEHVLAQLNFIDNHDVSRFRTAVGGDGRRLELAHLLLFTCPGAPCLYYGDEVGLGGGLPPNSVRAFPPEDRWDRETLAHTRALAALRRDLAPLRRGAFRMVLAEGRSLAFARWHGDELVLVAVNASEEPVDLAIPLDQLPPGLPDPNHLLFGAAAPALAAGTLRLPLGPLSGAVLGTVRPTAPRVGALEPSNRRTVRPADPSPREVVVVGNIGVDTNVYLPPWDAGPTVEGTFTDNLDTVGQAGGYCSFGFARLGRRTGFLGYVGDDPLGAWIRDELSTAGIAAELFIDPAGTSRSINLMRPDGRRNNFYDGKSHMTLRPELGRCERLLAGARLVHFHLPNWARHLLPLVKANGQAISCDLQDLTSPDDPYRQDFIDAADVVFFSATNVASPEAVAEALLARRPDLVIVVGLGSEGAALATRATGFRRFSPLAHPLPVIDTNGAGDSLAVGFLTAWLLECRPLEEAVRWGQIAARHTCTLRGGWRDLITPGELAMRLGQS